MQFKIFMFFLVFVSICSCSQQQARKPISQKSGTFMKESAERNRKLVALEEKRIDSIMKKILKTITLHQKKVIGILMKQKMNLIL